MSVPDDLPCVEQKTIDPSAADNSVSYDMQIYAKRESKCDRTCEYKYDYSKDVNFGLVFMPLLKHVYQCFSPTGHSCQD
jgi:hypothetical protein